MSRPEPTLGFRTIHLTRNAIVLRLVGWASHTVGGIQTSGRYCAGCRGPFLVRPRREPCPRHPSAPELEKRLQQAFGRLPGVAPTPVRRFRIPRFESSANCIVIPGEWIRWARMCRPRGQRLSPSRDAYAAGMCVEGFVSADAMPEEGTGVSWRMANSSAERSARFRPSAMSAAHSSS